MSKELKRMNSPMRFVWGPYAMQKEDKCLTGCVMGVKMFLGLMERYAGVQAFADADPVVFVIGRPAEAVDAKGAEQRCLVRSLFCAPAASSGPRPCAL